MNPRIQDILAVLRDKTGPAQVVPPSGISAWLIVFAAAAMTFLAVVGLAFALSANRVSATWTAEIARTATIRISAPLEQIDAQTKATLDVLATTPGIASAVLMTRKEQAALLAPWMGSDLPLDELALPKLIKITETDAGPDRDGMKLRLQAEAPGAIYDDHGRWRAPVVAAAKQVSRLGFLAFVLTLATLVAVIVLAAQAAIIANRQVIETLRLVGARDLFIARAFVRRITLRGVFGASLGAVAGLLIVMTQPVLPTGTGIGGLRFVGVEWFYPIILPLVVGGVTFVASRMTTFSLLRKLT